MNKPVPMEDLVLKQKELMEKVPHDVKQGALLKMVSGLRVIDSMLKYLNSTGHKPWRPIPLSEEEQKNLLTSFRENTEVFNLLHNMPFAQKDDISKLGVQSRQMISAYGIIEESVEYMNSIMDNDPPAHKIEELTDILFFYLEQIILSGFSWGDICEEYYRKHAVNLKRYEDGKKNDYSWDKRGTDTPL